MCVNNMNISVIKNYTNWIGNPGRHWFQEAPSAIRPRMARCKFLNDSLNSTNLEVNHIDLYRFTRSDPNNCLTDH